MNLVLIDIFSVLKYDQSYAHQVIQCITGIVSCNYYVEISDCKSLFDDGITTSGVYTVNPDGGTPFEVS